MMIDTGTPEHWPDIERQLEEVLGHAQLDYVFPTHPEIPHAGNLGRLLTKYAGAVVVGNVQDYHLYYPEFETRLSRRDSGARVDLAGGVEVEIVDAVIGDLPNTRWAYEKKQQVLFVSDGLAYSHLPPVDDAADGAMHRAGDCARLSHERSGPLGVEQAIFVTRSALFWSRYVAIDEHLREFNRLIASHPVRFVCAGPRGGHFEPT